MNANKKPSTAAPKSSGVKSRRLMQMKSANEIGVQFIRVHSRPFVVGTILFLTVGMLVQPASAGPFDALKNFFTRPQPQAHVTHHRPAHPKEAKDAPKDEPNDSASASPVAPPVDQQSSGGPGQQNPGQQNGGQQNAGQQNTLNTNNRPGRPALAAAPLF